VVRVRAKEESGAATAMQRLGIAAHRTRRCQRCAPMPCSCSSGKQSSSCLVEEDGCRLMPM